MDVSFLPQLDVLTGLYSERLKLFERDSDEHEKILKWISEKFVEEVTVHLVSTELEEQNVPLSVLGIGSGNGKKEVQMLIKLLKKFPLIECTVVEPSAERISSYKQHVEEQKDALDGVTFDWRQVTIQEFCKAKAKGSKKFHFVSAIHSCYYIAREDLGFCLKEIFRYTEDTNCSYPLQEKFRNSSHTHQISKDILDCLKIFDICFKTSVLSCELDVTSCFESDSRDGQLLLDFLLQVVGCIDDGPPGLKDMIKQFLKSKGTLYTRNGRLYVPVPTQIIVASTGRS